MVLETGCAVGWCRLHLLSCACANFADGFALDTFGVQEWADIGAELDSDGAVDPGVLVSDEIGGFNLEIGRDPSSKRY